VTTVNTNKNSTKPQEADNMSTGDKSSTKVLIHKKTFITKRKERLTNDFTLGKKLGEGAYGMVRLAYHKKTKLERAIKSIRKNTITTKAAKLQFLAEVTLLAEADHPNIIRILSVYCDK
jgi:serine/threonine protein kinase